MPPEPSAIVEIRKLRPGQKHVFLKIFNTESIFGSKHAIITALRVTKHAVDDSNHYLATFRSVDQFVHLLSDQSL